MKVLIAIIILLWSSSCFSQDEKNNFLKSDSLLIDRIKKAKPNNYVGKTLNNYLSDELLKKFKEWLPVDEPPGKLYAIILFYSEKIWVEIIFVDILYQKRFSEKGSWNSTLLKKEKIYKINYPWEE